MERNLSLTDVQKAVDSAYEQFKSLHDGAIDPRMAGVDEKSFGIAVVLTDGTTIVKGDADVTSPLGSIALMPMSAVLLSQNTPDELVKKANLGHGCCCKKTAEPKAKPEIGVCLHGLKAISAIVPQGDPEGKMDIITNQLNSMIAGDTQFDDKLYETLKKDITADVDKLAAADFQLFDDSASSLDMLMKLESIKLSAKQLATLGATIAADGVNPATELVSFDGKIAAPMVALMAQHGKKAKKWMMVCGLPTMSSFGGAMVAVLPGFGAIAAYAPLLSGCGRSMKGKNAIQFIANQLQLNVFASARVKVVK